MKAEVGFLDAFEHGWGVELLNAAPLIAPVRQYTFPLQVPGEEDALGRGALLLMVKPAGSNGVGGGSFMATCALGFVDVSMPTGVYACPNPDEVCAVAGGYAYIIHTHRPERTVHIALKPVAEVRVLAEDGLLLFVGFHSMVAWGREGLAWATKRLSWEGVKITEVAEGGVRGVGWDLMKDREVEFRVDLRTGESEGGGFGGG